jgi:hypothetical protein
VIQPGEFSTSKLTARRPDDNDYMEEIFYKLLFAKSAKGPFEVDDVLIRQFGLAFELPATAVPTTYELEKLASMAPKGFRMKVNHRKSGSTLIRFHVFDNQTRDQENVSDILIKAGPSIREIYDEMLDYWGEEPWHSVYFETEESLYG